MRVGPNVLVAGAILVSVSGCGTATAGSHARVDARPSVVHITYWSGHPSGALHAAEVALVRQFNTTHRDIQVQLEIIHASQKGLAAFLAGQAPNVAMVSRSVLRQWIAAGALVNLTPYIRGAKGLSSQSLEVDYYPIVWHAVQQRQEHAQYLMPLEKKVDTVIYYNPALLQRAGIAQPPRTWSELAADARRVSALGGAYHGIAWTPRVSQFLALVKADGGHILDPARTGFALDSPAGVAALTLLRHMVASGSLILTSGYQYQQDFGTGTVGFLIDESAGYTYDLHSVGGKFAVGAVPALQGTSGHSANEIAGADLAMFRIGTPAQRAAAWTFIRWMSSPAANAYWDRHTNYVPLGPAAAQALKPYYAGHPAAKASLSDPRYWFTAPRRSTYAAAKAAMLNALEAGLKGQLPVPAALRAMDTQGTAYLSGKVRG